MFNLCDGKIKFITHIVAYGEQKKYCKSAQEKDDFIAILTQAKITYEVSDVEQPSTELIARCEGKTFKSYESALAFVNSEPDINDLKKQLEDTDYRIIKCMEYQLAGLELPYDIVELHSERQAIRDNINQLETC